MIEAAEKCPDARRVPIRACVSCQIDRLKSGFEAMGRTVIPGICALMGATRLEAAEKSQGTIILLLFLCSITEL